MNTPEPCDTCIYLNSDVMYDEDTNDIAECGIPDNEKNWGNKDCPDYLHWTEDIS